MKRLILSVLVLNTALVFAASSISVESGTEAALDGQLCFNDSQCAINEHCAIGGSGAGECRENPVVGECRTDADCNWPKMCFAFYCK